VIGFRISGDEHIEGGLSLADTQKIVPILENEGIDYIHLSSGAAEAKGHMCPAGEGVILPEAEAIKGAVSIPVICPNFHTPRLALPFTRILYARRLSTFKFESLTHNLQEGISTPHDLMAWWWITLPVKVAPNPGN
jgi:hypothetical protein